jgi:hypothetical protein
VNKRICARYYVHLLMHPVIVYSVSLAVNSSTVVKSCQEVPSWCFNILAFARAVRTFVNYAMTVRTCAYSPIL